MQYAASGRGEPIFTEINFMCGVVYGLVFLALKTAALWSISILLTEANIFRKIIMPAGSLNMVINIKPIEFWGSVLGQIPGRYI